MALSEKQEMFCQFYVGVCKGNGREAAVRAGYSDKAAYQQAYENLRKPDIISRIKELRREALEKSGYSNDAVKEIIFRRLLGIVSTAVTDVVQVSPDGSDPNREAVLNELAALHGGQRMLDFGELLVAPSTSLTEEEAGAIKRLSVRALNPKSNNMTLDVEMNDVIAAAKLLAEITGIKEADTSVTVNTAPAVILQVVEERRKAAGHAEAADG